MGPEHPRFAPPTSIANSTTSIPKSSASQQGVQKQTTPRRNVVQNKQTGLFEQEVFSTPPPGEISKTEIKQDPTLGMDPAIKMGKREVELLHYLQSLTGYKVDVENDRITSLSTNRTVRASHLIRAILRKNGDLSKVDTFLHDIIPEIPGAYINNTKLQTTSFGGRLLNKKFPASWIKIF